MLPTVKILPIGRRPALDASRTAKSFTSLRDMVLRRVRADIVSGHAGPGTMYSVPALADEIGVSTTPVREALLELSHSGLITPCATGASG